MKIDETGVLVIQDLHDGGRKILKALISETRWDIIQILKREGEIDITGLSEILLNKETGEPQTEANVSAQIKILQKQGIIACHYEPGEHGVRKLCSLHPKLRAIKVIIW